MSKIGKPSIHYPPTKSYNHFYELLFKGEYTVKPFREKYKGFTDIPFAYSFKGFYEAYPEAKFILTTREKEAWLNSCDRIIRGKPNHTTIKIRKLMYGCESFNRKTFSKVYDDHYNDVINFFSDKKDQLLVYHLCSGAGWDPLLDFLNTKNNLNIAFPHKNMRK